MVYMEEHFIFICLYLCINIVINIIVNIERNIYVCSDNVSDSLDDEPYSLCYMALGKFSL
jgi:hypothetical protein